MNPTCAKRKHICEILNSNYQQTASLDLETDEKILNVIRSEFSNSTVLTIAHRLDSIIESDRILVLDQGFLKECDKPSSLLRKSDSLFSALVDSVLKVSNTKEINKKKEILQN